MQVVFIKSEQDHGAPGELYIYVRKSITMTSNSKQRTGRKHRKHRRKTSFPKG